MPFIDAHAHLTFEESDDVEALLKRAREANIAAIINVCTNLDDLQRGLALAKACAHPKIFTAGARTPHEADIEDAAFFAELEKQALTKSLVAIGETGLDYYYQHASKEGQIASLGRHIELACKSHLPLVIHCRDAFTDLFAIFDEAKNKTEVMLHCFTGTIDEAKMALDRGWYISLSGIVTFPKSTGMQEVAKYVPLDRLFIETDSPYLAPQGYRGQKNEPARLIETAKMVAALRKIDLELLASATTKNVERVFHVVS